MKERSTPCRKPQHVRANCREGGGGGPTWVVGILAAGVVACVVNPVPTPERAITGAPTGVGGPVPTGVPADAYTGGAGKAAQDTAAAGNLDDGLDAGATARPGAADAALVGLDLAPASADADLPTDASAASSVDAALPSG
ncbi:MAG: hypothetical protein EXR79_12535 [Myxococcales bacterium]|nr:hypothetical protein [Myxococcales bacterium]